MWFAIPAGAFAGQRIVSLAPEAVAGLAVKVGDVPVRIRNA